MEEQRIGERRVDGFLATLAHELRNPLASMHMAMEVFETLLSDDPTLHELTLATQRQLRYMTRLVDDLADASSILAGKVVLKNERLDLREVVRLAIELAAPVLVKRRHSVVSAMPDDPVYLEADPVRLAQLVSNLLTNAAKFTPDAARIELCLATDEQQAVIIVSDNGIGIEPAMLPRLFDRFVQADVHADGSMGLGLPLVRRIAELHGGTVVARSAGAGRGSEFVVHLPLRAPRENDMSLGSLHSPSASNASAECA